MGLDTTTQKLPYLDTTLSLQERVKDLISRLTLDEKVGMMDHPAQGVPLKHPCEIKDTWTGGMSQSADLTIVCAGTNSFIEGEEGESLLSPQTATAPTSRSRRVKLIT